MNDQPEVVDGLIAARFLLTEVMNEMGAMNRDMRRRMKSAEAETMMGEMVIMSEFASAWALLSIAESLQKIADR